MTKKINWLLEGSIFGVTMLLFSVLLDYYNDDFVADKLWVKIPIFIMAGITYGLFMRNLRKNKTAK